MDYRVTLVLLLFNFLIPLSSGTADGVCTSQGGRFPPFSYEGKPPRRVSKGPKDLIICNVFRKRTCCDVTQTHRALLTIRKLASSGEASRECLQLWELLECSVCDPIVGVQPGPPRVCASLCDRVFQACADAYLTMDTKTQVLAPCGASDVVCGKASNWASNGTDLCQAIGFAVKPYDDINHEGMQETSSCYDGKASVDSISDAREKDEIFLVLEDFLEWIDLHLPFSLTVSWAILGMVLTAGLFFISKRKDHGLPQNLADIQRARRLEAATQRYIASEESER